MRILTLLFVLAILSSCGSRQGKVETNDTPENNFQTLISNLRKLENGYTYEMGKAAEGCYIPDKNSDSLFYNPAFPILGVLPNDGEVFSLVHFEPGDDLYPVMRTFDSQGKLIDQKRIVFGNCAGWDCEFDECDEKFEIVNQNTIVDILTLVTTPCDSLGNKDVNATKKEVMKKTVTIDKGGKILVEDQFS